MQRSVKADVCLANALLVAAHVIGASVDKGKSKSSAAASAEAAGDEPSSPGAASLPTPATRPKRKRPAPKGEGSSSGSGTAAAAAGAGTAQLPAGLPLSPRAPVPSFQRPGGFMLLPGCGLAGPALPGALAQLAGGAGAQAQQEAAARTVEAQFLYQN